MEQIEQNKNNAKKEKKKGVKKKEGGKIRKRLNKEKEKIVIPTP